MGAIEKNLHDVLNAGLGFFQTVQGRFETLQKDIVSSYEDLVSKGAADKSQLAEKIRGTVDQSFNTVRDLQTKAESAAAKVAPKKAGKTAAAV